MNSTRAATVSSTALAATVALVLAFGAAPAEARPDGSAAARTPAVYRPGEVLVRFRAGSSAAQRSAARAHAGAALADALPVPRTQLLRLERGASVRAAVAALERRSEVVWAQPNYVRRAAAPPDDPRFAELWALHNTGQPIEGVAGSADADIDALEAWRMTRGSGDVTVAILDTGIDGGHPDIAGGLWSNPGESGAGREANGVDDDGNGHVDDVRGWSFVNGSNDPADINGHGTHVAGTVAARAGNGIGVTGVAPEVRLMAVQVLDRLGAGTDADIAAGFSYAARNGAAVVNASLGGPGDSPVLEDAVRSAPGTLFVVAAGNDGVNVDGSPYAPCSIAAENLICVAATDSRDRLAAFSNFGPRSVDLAAPGTSVLSTEAASGTILYDDFETPAGDRWSGLGAEHQWHRVTDWSTSGDWGLTSGFFSGYGDSWVRLANPVDLSGRSGCTLDLDALLATDSHYIERLEVMASTTPSTYTRLASWPGPDVGRFSADLSAYEGRPQVYLWLHTTGMRYWGEDAIFVDDVEIRCDRPMAYAPDPYAYADGTSMAAPHAAGVAALVRALRPLSTVADVRGALLAGTEPKPGLAGNTAAGRLNAYRSLQFIEARSPETSIGGAEAGGSGARSARFRLAADEPEVSFECRLDGRGWSACGSPHDVSALADGAHRFEARATDPGGNTDPTPAVAVFSVEADADDDGLDDHEDTCPREVGPRPAGCDLDRPFSTEVSRVSARLADGLTRLGLRGLLRRGGGRVRIQLTGRGNMEYRLIVNRGGHRRLVAFGTSQLRRQGGHTAYMRLTNRGRRLLRGSRRIRARVRVDLRRGDERTFVSQRWVTLRR